MGAVSGVTAPMGTDPTIGSAAIECGRRQGGSASPQQRVGAPDGRELLPAHPAILAAHVMTTLPTSHATFLRALADRIGIRLIVLLPASRAARSLWLGEQGVDTDVAALDTWARTRLTNLLHPTDGSAVTAQPDAPDHVAFGTVRGANGTIAGVLAVSKERDEAWTGAERAIVDFTTDFYSDELADIGRRPLPRAGLDGLRVGCTQSSPLERWMRSAPTRGELFLLYQPEIDLRTREILAVEALVRWDHPDLGPLQPESFIALAEKSDLITILGTWVIEESLREFASWMRELGDDNLQLRVNVSPTQLADGGIVDLFATALAASELRGDQVCVEITEISVPADISALRANLERLRALGVRSAIDDLAVGYSTLSRLRTLPVDAVKIDRSIVSGVEEDLRAQAIVRAIVTLGADLDLEVVAEGVETAGEAATLSRLGCVRAQGHLFARPMNPGEVRKMLMQGRVPVDR